MAVKSNEGTFVPANPLMLEVAKLYLEKYERLEPDDRKLFRMALAQFTTGRLNEEQGKP
jgi:hypothetical protein